MSIVEPERLEQAGLRVDLEGAVLTVTLDKPERRNSQTPRMWHTLAAIGQALTAEVRVVVLKGAGDCFSAGIDTRLPSTATRSEPASSSRSRATCGSWPTT